MEHKTFLNASDYLHDIWRLSRLVVDSGWRPDVLLALWRGGAEVCVAMHEFMKASGIHVRHIPVKCSSYFGIGASSGKVEFEHAESALASLTPGTRVLVVDDVFDTGRTAQAVRAELERRECVARVACVYWKPEKNVTDGRPDFHVHETDEWLVFPHEMEGLTDEEIAQKDAFLATLLPPSGRRGAQRIET